MCNDGKWQNLQAVTVTCPSDFDRSLGRRGSRGLVFLAQLILSLRCFDLNTLGAVKKRK